MRARLTAARLPETETVYRAAPDPRRWQQGVPLAELVDVVNHWRTEYKWRSFEERLDRNGQFRTTIDDLGIHFLHRRSARADATPLVLTHGWPGSIAEFVDVVDELADPQDADAPALATDGLTAVERKWTEETRDFWRHRAAYAKQQATRPQTIGYSLVDSPVGLLAWILDEFAECSDTEDSPFETISIDRVLDDVTLYWMTRTGASSARIYYESHNSLDPELRVDVPSAVTMYPRDIEKCPRPWAQERYRQIVRWRSPESGGHFPSLEVPRYFVKDLQEGLAAVLSA
ncbi:epoxide hydrolase N-terminal domain-containing protein [Streptomyces sp. NPDC088801]|uniref:epoxide hydrolase N-terminal domain-containing protein n=1 Tax=Streptomyces sp. NPDC088801 TaxID=3365903 RepID=UPI0038223D66